MSPARRAASRKPSKRSNKPAPATPGYHVGAGSPDPIRIVPLSLPPELLQPPSTAAAIAAQAPQLTYRGGPLLSAVEVTTIFWGAAWSGAQAARAGQLNAFFDFIVTSALMDVIAEYGVTGRPIGHGKRAGTVTIGTPAPPVSVTDNAIRVFLQHQLATNAGLPAPDPNSLYFVFLPPGVSVVQGGTRSCQSFCGYHDAIGGHLYYAVMPYPGCNGCLSGMPVLDALTTTASHELCEAITDPVPGRGWYDDANGEIGDICAWKTRKLGSYTIQLEWSNSSDACV